MIASHLTWKMPFHDHYLVFALSSLTHRYSLGSNVCHLVVNTLITTSNCSAPGNILRFKNPSRQAALFRPLRSIVCDNSSFFVFVQSNLWFQSVPEGNHESERSERLKARWRESKRRKWNTHTGAPHSFAKKGTKSISWSLGTLTAMNRAATVLSV